MELLLTGTNGETPLLEAGRGPLDGQGKVFPEAFVGEVAQRLPIPPWECWAGRLGDTGLSRAAGSTELPPCQNCQAGVGQERDGISNANKHPWLQAQRIQLFLVAAGVQLPQRLNKLKQALNRGWEWEAAAGE